MSSRFGKARKKGEQEVIEHPGRGTGGGTDFFESRYDPLSGGTSTPKTPTESPKADSSTPASVLRAALLDDKNNLRPREAALLLTLFSVSVVFAQDNQASRLTDGYQLAFTFVKCLVLGALGILALYLYRVVLMRESGNELDKKRFLRLTMAGKCLATLAVVGLPAYLGWLAGRISEQKANARAALLGPVGSARMRAINQAAAIYNADLEKAKQEYERHMNDAVRLYSP